MQFGYHQNIYLVSWKRPFVTQVKLNNTVSHSGTTIPTIEIFFIFTSYLPLSSA